MKRLDIKLFIIIFFILIIPNWAVSLNGQVTLTLLEIGPSSQDENKCYQVNLFNHSSKDLTLAGQNYRLYYDASKAFLIENSISSLLPKDYTNLHLVQHFFDVDASGFGALPYDGHLGFINLATDLLNHTDKGLVLPSNETTSISIAEMCFNVVDDVNPTFTWAQDNLTHTYATAFVELTSTDGKQETKINIDNYNVTHAGVTSTQEANVWSAKMFPNPFLNQLEITFNNALNDDAVLKMYDIFGQLIITQPLSKGTQAIKLETATVSNGAYIIEIEQKDGSKSILKAVKTNN